LVYPRNAVAQRLCLSALAATVDVCVHIEEPLEIKELRIGGENERANILKFGGEGWEFSHVHDRL